MPLGPSNHRPIAPVRVRTQTPSGDFSAIRGHVWGFTRRGCGVGDKSTTDWWKLNQTEASGIFLKQPQAAR
jgi:hypothetical protein